MKMRKIFLPPELYYGIENIDYTTKGILFDLIYRYNLGLDYVVDEKVKILFGFFKTFFDEDIKQYKTYCETKKENGKMGGRPPKSFDNLENSQKPKKPKKPIDKTRLDNINNNIYILDKKDIYDILTEEEIIENKSSLYIIYRMIEMGYLLEKDKKKIYEDIKRVRELIKQHLPLKENGKPNFGEAFKITDGWVDYWQNPPKGKKYPTNFKSSLRTSFSIMTKPKNGKS